MIDCKRVRSAGVTSMVIPHAAVKERPASDVMTGAAAFGAVIRPVPGEWHPRMPERLDEEELADWRAGRDAVYQLAALTIGARLAVADA
jgi:hypothetical protein